MATPILHKLRPQKATKTADTAPKPRRSVTLASRALAFNPEIEPDARLHFKTDLKDLFNATENLKGLRATFALTEDSLVFAVDTILEAGIERLEAIHNSLQQTVSMLEPADTPKA